MTRINIAAPTLTDEDAMQMIRDLADMGFNVEARGPLFGEAEEPFQPFPQDARPPNPDAMAPNDRKAHYEAEVLREQLAHLRGEEGEGVENSVIAETGWHIVAMRDERSE